jgi:hypothetical protein
LIDYVVNQLVTDGKNYKIECSRSDWGGVFKSHEFDKFLQKGIHRKMSVIHIH